MKNRLKRLEECQKIYDKLEKKINKFSKINQELKDSKSEINSLMEYYYSDWLTDREKIDTDLLITCEDPIYDLINNYYFVIDELKITIEDIKKSLK